MQLGKIVGCVWATEKNPGLAAQRLLIVQPLTPELNETGKKLICTDSTGAGASFRFIEMNGAGSGLADSSSGK